MRVCHLSTVHSAKDVRIFEKECRSLAAEGYEVFLVARNPVDEDVDGVHILGTQPPRSRIGRMVAMPWVVLRRGLSTGARLFHFHDPELMPVGVLLKLLGKKVVYDVHENLPQDILHSKDYIPKWIRPPLSWASHVAEKASSWFFDGVVTVSDTFASRFPAKKTAVVRNYPVVTQAGKSPNPQEKPRLVVFTGGMTRTRCAVEMVRAMEYLKGMDLKLVFAGAARPDVLAEAEKLPAWERVENMGMLPREGVDDLLSRASVGLLMNYPRADYVEISSNKLYEYMLAGLPVVTASIPSWKRTVEEVGCGVVVDPLNPEDIASGIRRVLSDPEEAVRMGERGRQAALTRFTWASEAKTLADLYRRMLP